VYKKQEGVLSNPFFFRLSPDTPSSSHTSAIFRGVAIIPCNLYANGCMKCIKFYEFQNGIDIVEDTMGVYCEREM
jgi:hypothetical protein